MYRMAISLLLLSLQERDRLISMNAALEERCKEAEELVADFVRSVESLQANCVDRMKNLGRT